MPQIPRPTISGWMIWLCLGRQEYDFTLSTCEHIPSGSDGVVFQGWVRIPDRHARAISNQPCLRLISLGLLAFIIVALFVIVPETQTHKNHASNRAPERISLRVGVLGTGAVGRAIAGKLLDLGHEVVIGTRDVRKTMAHSEPDFMGNPPFSVWHKAHDQARLATFSEAATHGELIVNATSGAASIDALKSAGEKNLGGKILIDIANPLDFSKGMPPTLAVCNTDSLGEKLQRTFPKAKVVKTLNTMNNMLMVDPKLLANGDHDVFVSGDDPEAKRKVTELLRSFGWRNIIDLGDITTSRGAEMVLPIWVRLMGAIQTPMFNFKIVRP